jgi:hypothetical protein
MSFKTIPLVRGFNEIKVFYDLCNIHNSVICGGYARYCASPLPTPKVITAGDCDMFPKSEESSNNLLEAIKLLGYEVIHENHVSVTLKPIEEKKKELEYYPTPQIIKPIIEGKIVALGTPEEILSNFDFTIVRACIVSPTEILVDEDFENDERNKTLRLRNIHCPISSLLRCCKYTRKGYFLRPAEALKLFIDWTNRGTEYQQRIIELFTESSKGKANEQNPDGMTQEEIDELEALLRID